MLSSRLASGHSPLDILVTHRTQPLGYFSIHACVFLAVYDLCTAALKVLALSEMNLYGIPLLAANLLRHRIKVEVERSGTISRCTALVTQHVKRHSQVLLLAVESVVRT